MLENILLLSKKFISVKSTPDYPKDLEKILSLALSNLKPYTVELFNHNGVKSALVYNTQKRPKKFKILLNAHLDVIPGKSYQYAPLIKKSKLYGTGAMDMKANAACLITVFREVASKVDYPLAIQLVTDEEIGGFNGTKYQVEKGVRADFVIAGEPTNFDIVNKTKGVLWLKISADGKTAHGAYPWRGKNAIWEINKFLNIIKIKYPLLKKEKWATTINLSRVETNNKSFNKIPDDCAVWFDVRYIPEATNTIQSSFKKLMPEGLSLKVIIQEPPMFTDPGNEYLNQLKTVGQKILGEKINLRGAHGSSDARHFSRVNCPGIEFGPVGGGIGSDVEWVDILSLQKYYKIIKAFLQAINA